MITYQNIKIKNFFTEGFELSLPSKMEILITEGTTTIQNGENENTINYPIIEFDVESDPELDVAYDVYLLSHPGPDGNFVHIDRTELGETTIAIYEGDGTMHHTLLSFIVPAGAEDLNAIDLSVRNVIMEEEVAADEIPTE